MKNCFFYWFLLFGLVLCHAQNNTTLYQKKKLKVVYDSISLEKVSINNSYFKVLDINNLEIDTVFYQIDFKKANLLFKTSYKAVDSIQVLYLKYPEFLTKTYSIYDDSRVISNAAGSLYKVKTENTNTFKPFDGLNTAGSITRGITVGNNQNTTVNSNLDLQITGKISDKVSLRASIQDSNIPLQDGGYSQKLDEFDQVFIELFSDNWNVRAGDLFLENRQSQFLNFNKKVQGIATKFTFGSPENRTDVFASAAIVRGQYARSNFVGQEGNQGPYKLRGQNGELYVLVISGSERVFVNGILLQRGENNDYSIDYNAGEIIFNSTYPINSEMRIAIEYQYSDRNFTRFVTYGGVSHQAEKWSIGGYVYSENDIKNQPLLQNLSPEQVAILQTAGDNSTLAVAPSAFVDSFSENKVLYKKVLANGIEYFEYSYNPNEELFNVRFLLLGNNLGDYILSNSNTIGKIYSYIAPINGVQQGNYSPITRLIAPNKIQIATVLGEFNPNEKTKLDFEIGISNQDLNLYSKLEDNDNKGIATKFNGKQRLFTSKIKIDAFANWQYIQQNFKTIERLFTIEFNRDWNLSTFSGNQSLLLAGLDFDFSTFGKAKYQIENLDFSGSFSGTKHSFSAGLATKKLQFSQNASYLKSSGSYSETTFLRNQTVAKYNFKKNYIGGSFRAEANQEKLITTYQLSNLSQRFSEVGAFVGRGDSTKVFAEIGILKRANDSLKTGNLERVNNSASYYLKSKLIANQKTNLSLFINFRQLQFTDKTIPKENSLNSRLLYNDSYFNQLLQANTVYETASGTIAQQEFTYVEVNNGQGVYTWNDYNGNGIQELQEFEVAPFADQAKYVRVFLPNQIFIKTNQNKFSQAITFNPSQWANQTGFKKVISYFYNQTAFSLDRKVKRNNDDFNINPFEKSKANLLGLNTNFRNSIFYNRGKQNHSVTYTFLSNKLRSLLSVGSQENTTNSNQIQYAHLVQKQWLFNVNSTITNTNSRSDNYASRNFELQSYLIQPKISYLLNTNANLAFLYEFQNKKNQINDQESLQQQRLGMQFTYSGTQKFTVNGEFSLYDNKFIGNALSPVAFQMLEGLQPGKNTTWRLLLQKNLTQYLDLNINYQGRKSDTSRAIHTGNVQLRAFF